MTNQVWVNENDGWLHYNLDDAIHHSKLNQSKISDGSYNEVQVTTLSESAVRVGEGRNSEYIRRQQIF